GAGGVRALAVAGVHEGARPRRRAGGQLQHRPLRGPRAARPAGPHGRRHPGAAGAGGDRGRPRHPHRCGAAVSLATALTYALPHRLLSAAARRLAYSDNPRLRAWLIDTVTRRFGVDLSEAAQPDPAAYPTFNAFFTRALRPGARTPDPDPSAILMPADGRISQCGRIEGG